jgi:hypothetical protein
MRVVSATALILMLQSADAQEHENVSRATKAGHEVAVGHALRWNQNCEPLTPKLVLSLPPGHGSICARDFTTIAKRNVMNDDQTCVGKRIRGLQVIYLPQSDYVGHDHVDYVVQYPNMLRYKHVDIEVSPNNEAPAAKPGEQTIAPGKAGDIIVACAPLSS